jgi:Spy/CpxP family protein refolding chaperone
MNLLRRLVPGAFLAVALVFCGTTWADDKDKEKPKRPQPGAGFGRMQMSLVPDALQEKLKLTDEQKKKVEKLQQEFDDKNKDTFEKVRDAMRKAMQDRDREAFGKIRELMEPVRKSRGEFQDKVAALLTEEQKKTFEEGRKEARDGPPRIPGFPGGPGRGQPTQEVPGKLFPSRVQERLNLTDEQKEKLAKMQKDFEAKAMELLTDEQKKKLEEIKKNAGQQGPERRRPNPER